MRRPLYLALFFAALAAVCFLFFFRQHPVLRKAMGLRPFALPAPHYVDFVGGSDLWDGTAKTHTSGTVGPWKSSPYMQGNSTCSDNGGTHFGYTHTAGQQIFFKGGVTWPSACFAMLPTAGGASGTPDVYGVDQTYFTGGSFARPVWDAQGTTPTASGFCGGSMFCPTPGSAVGFITVDSIEVNNMLINTGGTATGNCNGAAFNFTNLATGNFIVLNPYLHGWTPSATPAFGSLEYQSGSICRTGTTGSLRVDGVGTGEIFDSDGGSVTCGTFSGILRFGGAIKNATEIKNIKIHDVMAGSYETTSTHDSEFYNIISTGPQACDSNIHTQVIEDDRPSGTSPGGNRVFNNFIHDNTPVGVTIYEPYNSYIYGNVMWNNGNNQILLTPPANDSGAQVGYVVNNTVDCSIGAACVGMDHKTSLPNSGNGLGTLNLQGNHWITNGSPTCFGTGTCSSIATINSVSGAGNVLMSTTTASNQNYTHANKLIPTAPTNSTVNSGPNLASLCTSVAGLSTPLCTDPRGAPWFGGTGVAKPAAGAGNWNSGAYQFQTTLSMSPSPIAFGSQIDGTTSAAITVTVTNNGTGSAVLGTPFFTITGTNAADFANAGGGTCVNGGTIAVSGSCTVKVTFTPAAAGARSAILTMTGTAPSADSMTGTGIAVSPTVSLNPTSLAFGNVTTGTSSGSQTVTLTNTGTASLSITSIGLTGTNANQFSTNTNTCGASLAVNASCSIKVVFSPTAVASDTANLTFTTNASTSPNNVSLTGSGVAPLQPTLSIAPSPAAFGNQATGTTSSGLTVTVTNSGPGVQTFATPFFVISGTNASDFARTGGTCADGGTLLGTTSCTIVLTFTPGATGARSGTLTINGTASIADPLTGTGTAPSVTLNPTSIAFANQTSGTSSGNQLVTLTNSGTGPLSITSIALTGANANQFSTNSSTCGSNLAQSASCTLNVVFSPTSVASFSASLTFTTNASTSPDNVTLTGTGIAVTIPVLSFSPSPGAFGNQLQGTTSAPLTITVSNVGTAVENLSTPYWTLSGANASSFANAGTGTCVNGGTIPVSGSCTVKLTFTPSTTGALAGTLTINGTTIASDSLTGTGTLPVIGVAPSPAAFGNQNVNSTSSPLTVTVSNTGTGTETLGTPYFTITGTNAADFANAGTGSCANAGAIAPSSSCTVNLTFTPSSSGARSATLNIAGTVNASDSLTGTGVAPILTITPSPGAFGNQNVNTTSSPLTITVTNSGTATETLSTPYFTITGTNAANFANAGTGTCANGGTIAVSANCTVNLTFTPSAAGARTATLNISGTVNGTDSLTGTGIAPVVSLSPTSIAFGNQTVNTSSGNHAVTLSNTGTASLTITSITLTGANASEFSTNGSTCGGSLAAAASCSLNVVFTPTTIASKSASLTFTTNAATSPDNVTLTGAGVAPAVPVISLAPSPGAFGNQLQNTTSAGVTVTVSNTGNASEVLANPFFTLTGLNAGDFARSGGTCANSGTIAASASCTVVLTFTPTATGARTAILNILGTVNASDTLTGTGTLPVIGLSPSPAAFGNQNLGGTSAPLTVTVSNTGTAAQTLSTPFFTITGSNVGDFSKTGGTCTSGGSIAASGSCTVILTFTPGATGARSATLTINGTVIATDSLTGFGVSGAVSLSPTSLNFGNQNDGTSSNNSLITLTNTGPSSLTINSIAVTGTNGTEFSINSSTCGASLAASASCTLNAVFSPTTPGAKSASVTFTTNAASSPDAVTMIGTGLTPSPNPTPAPAITLVSILPPGSVVLTGGSFAATPRYTTITQQGCSVDGITFQSPCLFSIACGNCSNSTTVRWNGTVVSQKYKNGVIVASVPLSLIPIPTVSTDYSLSLAN